jgi:hypothetical protein
MTRHSGMNIRHSTFDIQHSTLDSVAQTSKSAVSQVSEPARPQSYDRMPTWKSATQQVWKPALPSHSMLNLLPDYLEVRA